MWDTLFNNSVLALSAGDISYFTLLVCEFSSSGIYTALFAGGIVIIEPSWFTMLLSCEAKEEQCGSQVGYSEVNSMFNRLLHSIIVGSLEGI